MYFKAFMTRHLHIASGRQWIPSSPPKVVGLVATMLAAMLPAWKVFRTVVVDVLRANV